MMKRYNIPIFLAILTLAALFNIGLACWPESWRYSTAVSEISATPEALAEETMVAAVQPEPKPVAVVKEETGIIDTAEASVYSGSLAGSISQEEAEVLLNLRSMKEDLDLRAKALDERQRSIDEAEAAIAGRINELESLVAKLQEQLQQEQGLKSKKIKKLAAVYSSMKPEKAAPVITQMELDTVVQMFARMDDKQVGKILSFMPPEKAVSITQALTRQTN